MTDLKSAIPSPPDVEPPAEDFGPLIFVSAQGGELARLGVNDLGSVRPHSGGFKVHAYWSSFLPGGPQMRPAPSIEEARERLALHVFDWFAACGRPL